MPAVPVTGFVQVLDESPGVDETTIEPSTPRAQPVGVDPLQHSDPRMDVSGDMARLETCVDTAAAALVGGESVMGYGASIRKHGFHPSPPRESRAAEPAFTSTPLKPAPEPPDMPTHTPGTGAHGHATGTTFPTE